MYHKRLNLFDLFLPVVALIAVSLALVFLLILANNGQNRLLPKADILIIREHEIHSLAYGPGIALDYNINGFPCYQEFFFPYGNDYVEFLEYLERQGNVKWATNSKTPIDNRRFTIDDDS
jgi:hypothetical protein